MTNKYSDMLKVTSNSSEEPEQKNEMEAINKRLDELSDAIRNIPEPVDYTAQIEKLRSDMFEAFRSFSPSSEPISATVVEQPDQGPTIDELLGL